MASTESKTPRTDNRLEWISTAITCTVYFAYILAIAFTPDSLGRAVRAGGVVTWGMIGGVGVIVFSIGIALWYANHANRRDS
ncbi:MAG: DUF485 domain-containing protein [Alphaproteobacteria bacterium]|nr:DUF485 domain-containing protein [Alphaproteobacteria bacterium]